MRSVIKYQLTFAAWGCAACVCSLLLVLTARTLSDPSLQWIGTVILLLVLCMCVHFVRGTAQLFDRHVWELPALVTLICMPVFNLIVTGVEIVVPSAPFLESVWFSVPLIFFSLPAFFCYYFIYIVRKTDERKKLLVCVVPLFAAGAGYVALRLSEKTVLPLLAAYGAAVTDKIAGLAAALSVAVYLFGGASFIMLRVTLGASRAAGNADG